MTMLDQEIFEDINALAREQCATTQEDGAVSLRHCRTCNEPMLNQRPQARYCSRSCQKHSARDMVAQMERELKTVAANITHRYLNRDRYIGIDGRYEGPLNKSVTFEVKLAKDKGYHPMPIDVHVRAIETKFNVVTPEDVDWGHRQGRPTQVMPRKHNTFCAACVEMVIDEGAHQVRVTKGIYLPIEHDCNSVRVYDLRGTLLEVKPL